MALITIKNQGASGSCGGQMVSYYGQRLCSVYRNDGRERSAKYPYAQVCVPGGGSDDRQLADIYIKQGMGREADCPSYENGHVPSEGFMERPQDITSAARIGAGSDKLALAYAFPTFDLESVAQAASACQGVCLGIYGCNNGTWNSTQPKPPTAADMALGPYSIANPKGYWAHYVYGAEAQIYNGKKGIWIPQSWGTAAGIKGWQFLDEDYFALGAIWGSMVFIYNPTPSAPPQHTFNTDLHLGDNNMDVLALQQMLAYDGEFTVSPTGFYGQITAQAVLKFQIKYNLASVASLDQLGGHVVGPASRAKLNTLTK
jgi:hypothetical protein